MTRIRKFRKKQRQLERDVISKTQSHKKAMNKQTEKEKHCALKKVEKKSNHEKKSQRMKKSMIANENKKAKKTKNREKKKTSIRFAKSQIGNSTNNNAFNDLIAQSSQTQMIVENSRAKRKRDSLFSISKTSSFTRASSLTKKSSFRATSWITKDSSTAKEKSAAIASNIVDVQRFSNR